MTDSEKKDLIVYRISRAKDTLKEVNLHVDNELLNTAVNRLYYACYYAVIALLLSNEINVQTHAGVRQMFGLHFIKPGLIDKELGKFYSDIFDKRQTGDYDDFVSFTKEEVVSMIPPAQKLINSIEELLVQM
ncbi:MAG: HEPN domain-containing protein [Prolixibacteraceae bacterium]|nr:HEPN domain-containing protein [Prolixibacteraceae bacterium]